MEDSSLVPVRAAMHLNLIRPWENSQVFPGYQVMTQGFSWSRRNALRQDAVSIIQSIISVLCWNEEQAYLAGFPTPYVVSGYMVSSFKVFNCLTV